MNDKKTNGKITLESIAYDIKGLNVKISNLGDKVDAGFGRVDGRFDRVDERFDFIDSRFEDFDTWISEIEKEIRQGFKTISVVNFRLPKRVKKLEASHNL